MQCTYLAAGPWSWDWCSVSLGGPFKNKQANLTFALLIFFCNFTAFIYLFFTVNTKQKHCKRLTNYLKKKHYKTKSFHIKFWCMLFRLQPQKLPINIETFTMPSTRAKRKQNCICILINIKMSFLDMTCKMLPTKWGVRGGGCFRPSWWGPIGGGPGGGAPWWWGPGG